MVLQRTLHTSNIEITEKMPWYKPRSIPSVPFFQTNVQVKTLIRCL